MKTELIWVVIVGVALFVVGPSQASSNDDEVTGMSKLMQTVMQNYNKEILPAKPVILSLNLLLLKVKTTVEREGIFESVVALFLQWTDPRVIWNPADYNNVTELTFDSEKVWLPDIAMTNSAEHMYSISKDTQFVIRATHSGVFNFVPTGTAKTWCDLKLLTFPFDIQTCSIEFESWSLNSDSLRINESSQVTVDPNFSSLQFNLCGYTAKNYEYHYEMTDEFFSRLRYNFILRRKSSFYIINLIFPIATLSFIEQLVFFIPLKDSSSDRVGFATTNMLTLVVFQTIVTEEMPKTSDAVTALSKYIISLIILSGFGIFESVFVERLTRLSSHSPPRWLSCLLRKLCPITFERYYTNFSSSDIEDELRSMSSGSLYDEDLSEDTEKGSRRRFNLGCLSMPQFLYCPTWEILSCNNRLFDCFRNGLRRSVSTLHVPGFVSSHWTPSQTRRLILANNNANNTPIIEIRREFLQINRVPSPVELSSSSSPPRSISRATSTGSYEFPICYNNNNNNKTTQALNVEDVDELKRLDEEQRKISHRERQASKVSRANKLFRRKNMDQWEDVAARLDFVMFFLCTALSLILPIVLFLPLTLFDSSCPREMDEVSHHY